MCCLCALANCNWDRFRSQIARFDPNPVVLISDNDYKTWKSGLYVLRTRCALVLGTPDPRTTHSTGLRAPCPQSTTVSFTNQIQQSDFALYDILHPPPSLCCSWILSICILYVVITVIDSPPSHCIISRYALSSHPHAPFCPAQVASLAL